MENITFAISELNSYLVFISLVAGVYWAYFIGKHRDERGYQIIGKASIFSFIIVIGFVSFSMLFNLSGQIPNEALTEYLIFTYTMAMIVFALCLFIYNHKSIS
ncbi:hypothetical protein [Salsuginibacillus kocurii]|uniref:hypothetical protein n=1 Tax=Salsuginibacillus kocurii TaxID=427078 RepID=UPI000380EFDD|nr:hypothetical protein [Salsuginibacillus kocurii]